MAEIAVGRHVLGVPLGDLGEPGIGGQLRAVVVGAQGVDLGDQARLGAGLRPGRRARGRWRLCDSAAIGGELTANPVVRKLSFT
ncbi:hypothetical protein, partial [Streptomyces sp. NPDC007346]|uniref:hypothetical protein n=1 Tax=Streptomyces sp. NPDC007346 TaxID=3154682 RepID=UPI0034564F79